MILRHVFGLKDSHVGDMVAYDGMILQINFDKSVVELIQLLFGDCLSTRSE